MNTQNANNKYTAIQSPLKLKNTNLAQCIFLNTIIYLALFRIYLYENCLQKKINTKNYDNLEKDGDVLYK